MSDLVLKYSFESNEIDGLTVNNSSYGAKSLSATFSAQNMVSSNTYIVGGQSAFFSGSTFLSLPDISNLPSSITISLWAQISTSRAQRLLELRNSAQRFYIAYDASNNISFNLNSSKYTFNNLALVPSVWHHIAWVILPDIWYVYVNNNKNVIYQATNFTGTIVGANSFLGKGGLESPFSGYADDFRIYNGALSDDQIYEIYDRGTYLNYYRFETEDISAETPPKIANLASGFPNYDANIVAVSSPASTYGTSAFNVVSNVYKSGSASIYSNGTSGNHVVLPSIINVNPQGVTISVWYYAETNNATQTICSLGANGNHWVVSYDGANNQILFSQYSSVSPPTMVLRGQMRTDAAYPNGYLLGNNVFPSFLKYGASTAANRWNHITWSITPSYWKIQINGSNTILFSSAMMSSGTPMSTVLYDMPAAFNSNTLFTNIYLPTNLKGYIDDFRVYNRILSDDETFKLYYYRCLRTNYYTPEGNDLVNVFDYNTGVSAGVSTGYKNEANELIHEIFAPFSPALVSPQVSIQAHLFNETTIHISETISSDTNPVRAIDRIQVGQIVSSPVISGKPYVLSINRENNTVVLNKSGGTAVGNSGIGYSGFFSATNGVLNLLMDTTQQRSYSGNAPAVGDLVYHSLVPLGTYIKGVYDYTYIPQSVPTLINGNFTTPQWSNNTYSYYVSPYSAISNWTIAASNANIAIANRSTFFGFPTLPSGITQWLVVQSTGVGSSATVSRTFTLNSVGNYSLQFYTVVRQTDNTITNNTITASINGTASTGQLYVGTSAWSLQTLNFLGMEGENTMTFNIAFDSSNVSAIYLTGVSLSVGNNPQSTNTRSFLQYSLLLSNSSVNIPLTTGENVFWKTTHSTLFYTPTEFSGNSGYFLLASDGRYEDYVYKLYSLGGSNRPFTANGTYTTTDHNNGYYTITFTDFGSIKFVNDVSSIQLLVVGSGGAGGRNRTVTAASNALAGGGGGEGGQVVYYSSYGIIPNNVYYVDIGIGGIPNANGSSTNGSPSRFGNEVALGGAAGSAGDASIVSGNVVYVAGVGGGGLTNGGNGGNGGNAANASGQAGQAGVSVSFGVNDTAVYGGGGGGGNNGATNNTVVLGGAGGGGNNGANGSDGLGGGGGGGNAPNSSIGAGGKGVVMIYVGALPDPPRTLTPTTQTNTTIGLSFKAPNRVALSYVVYATPRSGGATISQSFTGTTYTITGLSPDTEYSISVAAMNSVGSSLSPSIFASTLKTASPKPTISAINIDNTSMDIVAHLPTGSASTFSGYLAQFYSPSAITPTYTSQINAIHFSNLVKNTWYVAYINGTTTYGTIDVATQLVKTKNIADAVGAISTGTRTGETIEIIFERPSTDNGAQPLFHYTFDDLTVNGANIGNIANGSVVYDASLSTASVSTTNRYGNGSLFSNSFNGFPMKINNTYNFSLYSAISICLWVNPNRFYRGVLDSEPLWLFSFNNDTTTNRGIIYALRFQPYGGFTLVCGNRTYSIPASVTRNAWSHIAITQTINTTNDGTSTMNFYTNGILRHTNSAVNTFSDNMVATINYLGSQNDGDAYYDGYIDDYRLYNTELSASQVASAANNTISSVRPIDNYRVYYSDITDYNIQSMIAMYKIHPYTVKSGRIVNLRTDAISIIPVNVYDASLINFPPILLSKNIYEISFNRNWNQCVQLSAFTMTAAGFTFACWFRSNGSSTGASIFYSSSSTLQSAINVYISGNDLVYSLNNGMTAKTIRANNMNANNYNHLVLIIGARSGTTCTVSAYINGVATYTESGISYPTLISRTNNFLGRNAETNEYLNGGIYDVFMWNRPISFTEVSYLYNNGGITYFSQNVSDNLSSNVSYTINGLNPRKLYTMTLSTVNVDGESYANVIVMKTRNVPDSPAGFSVYGITDISASFQFIPPDQPVAYYLLSIKTYSSQTSSYITYVDLSLNDTPYDYGGFVKNTTYTAFLYAINNDGISPYSSAIFTTLKEPDPPSNIVLTIIGNTFVEFTFSQSFGYNVLAYDLSAITQDVGKPNVFVSFAYNMFMTTYRMTGLRGGVNYTLYLTARNIYGSSTAATASFKTTFVPNSPTNFVVSTPAANSLTISFTAPEQEVTQYTAFISPSIPTNFINIGYSPQTVLKTQPSDVICMAITSSATGTRLAILGTNTGLKYIRVLNGIWGDLNTPVINHNSSPTTNIITACAITGDGLRILVAYGMGRIYWGDSAGIYSGTGNALYLNAIADTSPRLCYGLAFSQNANRIVATEYNGYVYFSAWNGANYSVLNRTYDTVLRKYGGIDITANGDKIVYCGDSAVYWAYWNGANYLSGTPLSGTPVNGTRALNVKYVAGDADMIVVSSLNGRPQYSVWDYFGENYYSLTDISANALPTTQGYGLACDASRNIYLSPYSNTNLYSTAVNYAKISPMTTTTFSGEFSTATITGLLKNTLYDISLVAYNVYGGSLPATTTGTTTNPPDAVSSIFSLSSNISADLSYCAPRQSTSSYYIAVESGGIYYYKTSLSLSTSFKGLYPSTSYIATIRALNADGSSPDASYGFATSGLPSAPNRPVAWSVSPTTADVYFTLPEYDLSAAYFNGNTQIVAGSAAAFSLTSGTVECWFKTSSTSAGICGLVVKKNAYGLFINNTKLGVFDYVSNAWDIITSFSVNDNYWHHAALVFQNGVNGGSALYFDGFLVSPFTYSVNVQTSPFSVGCVSGEAANYVGFLGEVRIWSAPLSATTIQMYYNKQLRQLMSGLVGYFPMNEGEIEGATAIKNAVKSSSVVNLPITPSTNIWRNEPIDIIDLSNTSYTITFAPSSGATAPIIANTFAGRNVSVSGLTPNTNYSVYLTAANNNGRSPTSSAPLSLTTRPASSPFPPSNFTLLSYTDVSFAFSFSRPADNPSTYTIYASPIYTSPNSPITATITSSSASVSGVFTGLTRNVKYLLYSTATLGGTTSPPSNSVLFTTPFPSPSITLNSFTDASASITVAPADYFAEYYIATFTNNWGGSNVVASFVSPTSTILGLASSTLYSVSVVAVAKGVQSLPSNSVAFFSDGTSTSPQNLAVSSFGDTTATISFNAPQYGNVSSYRVVATTGLQYVSSLSFSTYTTIISGQRNDNIGFAISQPASVRLAIFATLTNISYSRIVNGAWGTYTAVNVSGIASVIDYIGATITYDGTRAVVIHGTLNSTGLVYWGDTTNLLNGSSANLTLTQTLETNTRNYVDVALSANGNRLVALARYDYVYVASWNGTNYSAFVQTANTAIVRDYQCICISSDGDRIAYCENANVFWAAWDAASSSYVNEKYMVGSQSVLSRSISFLGDNKDVIIYACPNSAARYFVWNGVNYELNATSVSTTFIPATDNWGFAIDASNVAYIAPYNNNNVFSTVITPNYSSQHQVIRTFSAPASSYTIPNLLSYKYYDISLVAVNSFGASPIATTSFVCGGTTGTLVSNLSYTLYRFTQTGTITITGARTVYYVIVGGGGNGPNASSAFWNSDSPGAGAGGIVSGVINQTTSTTYLVYVGQGGVAAGFTRIKNAGNPSRLYYSSSVLVADGGQSSESGLSGGAAGTTTKGLSGVANVSESGAASAGSNKSVGFPASSYTINIGGTAYYLGGGGAGGNSSTAGQTSIFGGGGGAATGVSPTSGVANSGGGGGGHIAFTSSTNIRSQTAAGGSGVVLIFY